MAPRCRGVPLETVHCHNQMDFAIGVFLTRAELLIGSLSFDVVARHRLRGRSEQGKLSAAQPTETIACY